MFKPPTRNERIANYFRRQDNDWDFPAPRDASGKALLPLDRLVFEYYTDERVPLFLAGTVGHTDLVGELNPKDVVSIMTPFRYSTFGVPSVIRREGNKVLRLPNDPSTFYLISEYISDTNRLVILEAGGVLHIQGVPIIPDF